MLHNKIMQIIPKAVAAHAAFLLALAKTTLLSHVAEIVKSECCTCSQGQLLRKNR